MNITPPLKPEFECKNDTLFHRLANDHGHDHVFELDFQRLNGRLIDYGRPGWSSRIIQLENESYCVKIR